MARSRCIGTESRDLRCRVRSSGGAQSFQVQCPTTTTAHPAGGDGSKSEQLFGRRWLRHDGGRNADVLFAFGPLRSQGLQHGMPGSKRPRRSCRRTSGIRIIQRRRLPPRIRTAPWVSIRRRCARAHRPRPVMDVGVPMATSRHVHRDRRRRRAVPHADDVGQIMRRTCSSSTPCTSRLSECLRLLRRRAAMLGGHQHRRSASLLLPRAGRRTYVWHCHITPPEHLQMGMVASSSSGRADKVSGSLNAALNSLETVTGDSAGDERRTTSASASAVAATSCARALPAWTTRQQWHEALRVQRR